MVATVILLSVVTNLESGIRGAYNNSDTTSNLSCARRYCRQDRKLFDLAANLIVKTECQRRSKGFKTVLRSKEHLSRSIELKAAV